MPQTPMVKQVPKQGWEGDAPGQKKGRGQHQESGSLKPEIQELKVKIDHAMSRFSEEVNRCMSDWARRQELGIKSLTFSRPATAKHSPPPIPALPNPEMFAYDWSTKETPVQYTSIPGAPEMVLISEDLEEADHHVTSPSLRSPKSGQQRSRPETAPVRHVIPNDQIKASHPQRSKDRVGRTDELVKRRRTRLSGAQMTTSSPSGGDRELEYSSAGPETEAPLKDQHADTCAVEDDGDEAAREEQESIPKHAEAHAHAVFANAEELKEQMKQNHLRSSTDEDESLLHANGMFRTIALHPAFEYATLSLIGINALWMGYDTDANDAATLLEAGIQFVIMENIFCTYFTLEWAIRFFAFKRKCMCYKDRWFVFDSCLVLSMILETWVLTAVLATTGGSLEGSKALRWLRLGRLTRLARMARLLRAMPELLIMVKAIVVSMRTVVYALVLLIGLVYVFSIAFTQLMDGKNQASGTVSYQNFRTVSISMNTLLLSGALPDQADMITKMMDESPLYYVLMLVFLFIASLTVMNMLIGIVCDVISAVSDVEKESIRISNVKEQLKQLMRRLQIGDEHGSMKQEEYEKLLMTPCTAKVLDYLGVDIFGLVELSDFLFDAGDRSEITFPKFMDAVLELRASNTATVKHVIELGKFVSSRLDALKLPEQQVQHTMSM